MLTSYIYVYINHAIRPLHTAGNRAIFKEFPANQNILNVTGSSQPT